MTVNVKIIKPVCVGGKLIKANKTIDIEARDANYLCARGVAERTQAPKKPAAKKAAPKKAQAKEASPE